LWGSKWDPKNFPELERWMVNLVPWIYFWKGLRNRKKGGFNWEFGPIPGYSNLVKTVLWNGFLGIGIGNPKARGF